MSLDTISKLPLLSPLAEEPVLEVSGALHVRDLTPSLGVLHLRGPEAEAVVERFNAAESAKITSPAIGETRSLEAGVLCRLAADEYLLLVEKLAGLGAAYAALEDVGGGSRVTLSDLTHAYGKLLLSGRQIPGLLPRLCGLDTSEAGFPDGRAAQTSLAKIHATLARVDEKADGPSFYLLVDRSLTAYVWEVIEEVVQAFIPG